MHEMLRERIDRHLESLPEERLYQVLDYIEFLSSKYARDQLRRPASPIQAFGERLEDRLRVNRVGMGAIRGTLGVVGTADRVVSGIANVGRSILRDAGGTGTGPASAPTRPPAPPRGPEDIPVDG